MPRISIDQFPTVARSGRVSVYAEQMKELEELLGEDDFGAGQGLQFEIDKDNLSALVSSLRKSGKGLGRKVKTVFKDGNLYVTDGGPIEDEADEDESETTAVPAGKAKATK